MRPIEHKFYEIENNIDPESNFYNNLKNTCEYYTEEQFKQVKMDGNLSIIHFNSRSLNKNIGKIKKVLEKNKKFSVIAVSETWLNDQNDQKVELVGYEMYIEPVHLEEELPYMWIVISGAGWCRV